jgi:hypothetical protein
MRKTILWLIVLGGFCATCFYGFRTANRRLSDFAGYYTASHIFVERDSVSHMYHDEWFKLKAHSYGIPDSTFIIYVNPPPVSLVMTPFVWMNPRSAKIEWNIVSVLLLLLAIELLRRLLQVSYASVQMPVLALVLSSSLPFLRNLQRGQIYVFMLVILILFSYGYLNKKPFLTALTLSAFLLLKYFGWMFVLLLLIERRWKELTMTLSFTLAGLLLGVALFGIETYAAAFTVLQSAFAGHDFAITGLPSMQALFGGLLTFHPLWNAKPVLDAPVLATVLTFASLIAVLGFTFFRSSIAPLHKVALLAILSVIFTPLAADHHYMLMPLPAGVFLFDTDIAKKNKTTLVLSAVMLYALIGWYPQPAMNTLAGWMKVMAFPRLYAAVALWFVILMARPRSPINRG